MPKYGKNVPLLLTWKNKMTSEKFYNNMIAKFGHQNFFFNLLDFLIVWSWSDNWLHLKVQTYLVILLTSLWQSDAIQWHKSRSTLVQVMACCLMAPSHYLNQCWLIISRSSNTNLRTITREIPMWSCEVSFKPPRGQWVNLQCLWF